MFELGFQGSSNTSSDGPGAAEPPLLNHFSVPLTPNDESVVTLILRGKKRKVTVTIEDYAEK